MNVVVLYESMTGNTQRAAELIGGAVKAAGCDVSVRSVRAPTTTSWPGPTWSSSGPGSTA